MTDMIRATDQTRPDVRRPVQEGGTSRRIAPGEHGWRTGDERPAPSYYDVPMLKPPVWKWEIASYFFLGGVSGGAYALARMADRFGGGRYRDVTRAGTAVAFAAFLPCAPLLIIDLGDPKRFHYMLRIFKPKSPMNLGAWTLAAFGGILTLSALNEWRKADPAPETNGALRIAGTAIEAVADLAGVPLGLLLAGYTGVLLSTTSTPMWARNPWLGPLFSAGALSNGVSAIRLVLEAGGSSPEQERKPLQQLSRAAKVAEAAAMTGFLATAGDLAEPITRGKYAPHLWGGAIGTGLALSTALESLPVRSEKTRRFLKIAGAVAGLVGGLALRWAMTQGGRPSGNDPKAARRASRPKH